MSDPERMQEQPGLGLIAYRTLNRDRLGRRWVAEYDDCAGDYAAWMWSPRAWTRKGALRKGERWLRHASDIRRHERRYTYNPVAREARSIWLAENPETRIAP